MKIFVVFFVLSKYLLYLCSVTIKAKQYESRQLIDKACEWLKENVSKHLHGQYAFLKGLMIEEFKEAMKGE